MSAPPRYRSPELPPPEALAAVTAKYKAHNDARAAKIATGARIVLRHNSGLDELAEAARIELVVLAEEVMKAEASGEPVDRSHLLELVRANHEFCTALAARTSERRTTHLDAMHEAIASLDRYRGAGR